MNFGMRELDARRDAFGNKIRLLWNPADDSTHLDVAGFDIKVPKDKAAESRYHPYPLLCAEIGEVALDDFLISTA